MGRGGPDTTARRFAVPPPHGGGQRIGLFGGSFNPPHAGHRLVARTALRRLKLDRVWWLVTPGNPLKDRAGLPPQSARVEAVRALTDDPRMVVTGIEARLATRFTADTIARLRERSRARFVWIMGADGLRHFHRWDRWRDIAAHVPICVVDRPGHTLPATASLVATTLARSRIDEADAPRLPDLDPPAWVFLHGPRDPVSSTSLRGRGEG